MKSAVSISYKPYPFRGGLHDRDTSDHSGGLLDPNYLTYIPATIFMDLIRFV